MLRITHAQTGSEQRWTVCGHLAGPWVAELRTCWKRLLQTAGNSRTVVDLSDVTFIDENGEKLLSEMSSEGVDFVAAGVETIHLLKNLSARGERPLRRFIAPLANHREKPGITKTEESK